MKKKFQDDFCNIILKKIICDDVVTNSEIFDECFYFLNVLKNLYQKDGAKNLYLSHHLFIEKNLRKS